MQLKLLIAAALGLAVNASFNKNAPEMKLLWNTWKQLHSKTYSAYEEVKRFDIFAGNYLDILSHNTDKSQTYKKGLNQFSDLTGSEFKTQYASGYKGVNKSEQQPSGIDYSVLNLPVTVDWRAKGAVTGVKNQGRCGSCWAFSSTGALEGLNFITNGELLSFSEQQLVDCDTKCKGCNGGLMDLAFEYTLTAGIQVEQDYPYTAKGAKCKADASKAKKVNTGHTDVEAKNVEAMKTALAGQPVSVAIEADQNVFQSYSSGVITSGCGATLDHGVLAVGYTLVGDSEAFIVKNSWSDTWGNNGYVMIGTDGKANKGAGVCGILAAASFPTA